MNKFVLIDDDTTMNLVHSTTIKHHHPGSEVLEFKSSQRGLDYFKQLIANDEGFPEFLFLDINMPEINGFDFLQAFNKFPPEKTKGIKIFMITSSLDLRDREKAFSFDAVYGFVCKPITIKTLKEILVTTERRMDF